MRLIEPLQRMFPKAFEGGIVDRLVPSFEKRGTRNVNGQRALSPLTKPVEFRFKEFRIGSAYFKVWASGVGKLEILSKGLRYFNAEAIRPEQVEDILCEVLTHMGFSLDASVQTMLLGGREVYSASNGALLICLDRGVPLEVLKDMIVQAPEMILFLE